MNINSRQLGGQNNKIGNRYEDVFAVYRIICFLPYRLYQYEDVRIKEQANCPVDDLIIKTDSEDHYHQLKADKSITWGEQNNKLASEFIEQMKECQAKGRSFKLWLVVADEDRKKSLDKNMPPKISAVTSVFLFPRINRPSELAMLNGELKSSLEQIRAIRFSSHTEHQNIILETYTAWIEHEPDSEGYCLLSWVINYIRKRKTARIRFEWTDSTGLWSECHEILKAIPNLQFWTDRGYFEWNYPPTDRGMSQDDCTSESFVRFMHRIKESRPTTFEDLEVLLP